MTTYIQLWYHTRMEATNIITNISLTERQYEAVRTIAFDEKMSQAAVIRKAIDEYIAKYKKISPQVT